MSKKNLYKWTVMIYLAGDNSLDEESVAALADMANASRMIDENVAIVARLSTSVHHGTVLRIDRRTTVEDLNNQLNAALTAQQKQSEMQKNQARERRHGVEIRQAEGSEDDEELHMEKISRFVSDAIGEFTADHYMIVLSGHGAGVQGLLREDPSTDFDFSVIDLGRVIKVINKYYLDGNRVDILGFDSCLMSMTEVAYAVHNNVKVTIGAEGFEPKAGWPYAKVIERISKSDDDIQSLAKTIVCDYIRHYEVFQAANVSVDQSACDMDGRKR